jgi:tetratricopeptide (TPR) repeat protein
MAGDFAAAERLLREGYEELDRLGERGYLSTIAGMLAEAVFQQGQLEEALRYADVCEEAAGSDDADSQIRWRGVRAKVLARQGEVVEAERLAREAVGLLEDSEMLDNRSYILMSLSDILLWAGRTEEAAGAAEQALALYEAKGNVVEAGRTRAHLARLRGAQPPATA